MNGFKQACRVEDESWDALEPYLKSRAYEGRFVRTAKGPLALELQKSVGDVLVNSSRTDVTCIEVKAEREHTGNVFLERWSNRHRFTPGWLETLNTDLLWCHFLDRDVVYEIPFARLRQWMYWHEYRGRPNASRFDLAKQGRYEQLNDTWGYLVKLSELKDAGLIRDTFAPISDTFHRDMWSDDEQPSTRL